MCPSVGQSARRSPPGRAELGGDSQKKALGRESSNFTPKEIQTPQAHPAWPPQKAAHLPWPSRHAPRRTPQVTHPRVRGGLGASLNTCRSSPIVSSESGWAWSVPRGWALGPSPALTAHQENLRLVDSQRVVRAWHAGQGEAVKGMPPGFREENLTLCSCS